tara:strand:+ start:117 stop:1019 length:903 start_codon:yes stop_codon:yes gene_type:complete
MSKVKSLATLAKEMRKLRKKPTQEGVKFGTKKDIVMAKDTPFGKDLDVKVIAGREGKTAGAGKINVGDDAVGFTNFIKMQQSKSGLSISKYKEKLNQITRSKDATKEQKDLAQKKIDKMDAKDKADFAKTGRKISQSLKGKKNMPDGVYFNKQTGEEIKNPKFQSKLTEGGKENSINNWVKDPTKNQIDAANRNRIAREKTEFRREVEAKLDTKKRAPISTGSAVENKRKIGMNKGGLKMPTADQTGLKKLPTAVRNKMGYMYGGGMMKKPRTSNMDYRKGGMVMIVLDMMKKKNKKGKK